ncbi:MAG: PAS domain-containing protein, partial [Deltaproteobacteria bacterium]|nr:PAS domain-containing protein [Deltaproteobacteria bacterium]
MTNGLCRNAMTGALNKMVEVFTSHNEKTSQDVISSGIWPVADAAGLDRVAVYSFKNFNGEKRLGQIFRWDGKGGGAISLTAGLLILPDNKAVKGLLELLTKNICFKRRLCDMTEEERDFFGPFGLQSIMVAPVFVLKEFWGCVAFQDHASGREFYESCEGLLHTAARLCVNAIIRETAAAGGADAFEALKRGNELNDALNKAAIAFLSQEHGSFEDIMTEGVGRIAAAAKLDRLSLWQGFTMPDGEHAAQIYRWDKESGGTTAATPGLEDFHYSMLAPQWTEAFLKGEAFNGPVGGIPSGEVLRSFGVASAFVQPIFIHGKFWGIALFEDRHNERFFDNMVADMLRSAAFLCANTVVKAEMEREVSEKNELIRIMIEKAPVGLTLFDENLVCLDCNETVLQMFDVTREFYITYFGDDLHSPEFQPDGSASLEKASMINKRMMAGETQRTEWMHRRPDGELLPVELTLTRAKRGDKHIGLGYVYDLRHLKQLEQSIIEAEVVKKTRETDEFAHVLFDAMPVSCDLWDEECKILDCNEEVVRLFRLSSKNEYRERFFECSPKHQPDGRLSVDKLHELLDKTFKDGSILTEWMHQDIHGEPIPMTIHAKIVNHHG